MVKFSIYLNRRIFAMIRTFSGHSSSSVCVYLCALVSVLFQILGGFVRCVSSYNKQNVCPKALVHYKIIKVYRSDVKRFSIYT